MKKIIFGLLVVASLFTGCDSPEEAKIKTEFSFNNPEFVGTLRGKSVYRAKVTRPGNSLDHYVYICEDTLTVNEYAKSGKSTANMVIVFINEKSYTNLITEIEGR